MIQLVPDSMLRAPKHSAKAVHVVIETPRGSRNKFKYDMKLGAFRLKTVLPLGAAFPYDFGFVPNTLADDGDPLDVLVLMDEPAFTGCIVRTRLVGVIKAEQCEGDGAVRNDRLIAVARKAHNFHGVRSLRQLDKTLIDELIHFFVSYNESKNRIFRVIGLGGPKSAHRLVGDARLDHDSST
jgi:inorganic pyrophosphatase